MGASNSRFGGGCFQSLYSGGNSVEVMWPSTDVMVTLQVPQP
jgi:hypothetical protein